MKTLFKFFNSNQKPKSFTLIETMVAVTIVTIAILGPLSVAFTASNYAKDTKDVFTATYLAEEAIDLLKYERDSVFLYCVNNQSDLVTCKQHNTYDGNSIIDEIFKETSWRVFKENILNNSPSCFDTNCTFDFTDFKNNPSPNPSPKFTSYAYGDGNCDTIYRDDTSPSNAVTSSVYTCHDGGDPKWKATHFKRTVKLQDIKKVGDGVNGYFDNYEDDILVTVTVEYTKTNGLNRSIILADLIHSKS